MKRKIFTGLIIVFDVFIVLICLGFLLPQSTGDKPAVSLVAGDQSSKAELATALAGQDVLPIAASGAFKVTRVVDGDTLKVRIGSTEETIRLIGINTPETVDPRKGVECFGLEASNKAKELLTGKSIQLESDPTQGERDKYDRLLRYAYFEDGTSFNLLMIEQGYAYEYTYADPYKYQSQYKLAQKAAQANSRGLWAPGACSAGASAPASPVPVIPSSEFNPVTASTTPPIPSSQCFIKGNLSSSGEKIYHIPDCDSYDKTVITISKGERYFCTEQAALSAGWRKALNCPR